MIVKACLNCGMGFTIEDKQRAYTRFDYCSAVCYAVGMASRLAEPIDAGYITAAIALREFEIDLEGALTVEGKSFLGVRVEMFCGWCGRDVIPREPHGWTCPVHRNAPVHERNDGRYVGVLQWSGPL